jgi:C_GCAxxG_C_C family probable redox protein
MDEKQQALDTFAAKNNCSQSVLLPFAKRHGVSEGQALQIAAGFGAGIGQMAETCGAVTGACMVLGLMAGQRHPDNPELKQETYRLVGEFAARFREQYGELKCRDLLGLDISDADHYQQAKECGIFESRCPLFVGSAVEILIDMIENPGAES